MSALAARRSKEEVWQQQQQLAYGGMELFVPWTNGDE